MKLGRIIPLWRSVHQPVEEGLRASTSTLISYRTAPQEDEFFESNKSIERELEGKFHSGRDAGSQVDPDRA
jgi:hypothetical protein